jgi:outer membrane protein assembly factor BamB
MNDSTTAPQPSPPASACIRWRGLFGCLLIGGVGFAILEGMQHPSVQQKWMKQALLGIGLGILIAIWFFRFSKCSLSLRKKAAVLLALTLVALATVFRYDGVSGDLIPRFGLRWQKQGPPPLVHAAAPTQTIAHPPGAADFPQFFGPSRDGKLPGPALARNWETNPPVELWRKSVGKGWSGFAVSGGLAITQEQREDQELIVCYELASGRIVWFHEDNAKFDNALGGVGPRTTVTIVGERVFSQGATGILNCLELATGKRLWSVNIVESNAAEIPEWGVSASPLVRGDAVIVAAGQPKGATLAAYHQQDGTRLWMGGNQTASYSSPILATLGGMEQILYFGPKALAGFDAVSGKLLWEHPWFATSSYPHVAIPLPLSADGVMVSSGYGQGSGRAKIARQADGTWTAEETWATNRMKAKFTNLIEYQGHVYGLDDGQFACFDPHDVDGKLKWREGKLGHGQILLVKDVFLVMAEEGQVVLVEPSPDGYKQLTQFKALTDKTWNPPCLAGKYLLVRNDREAVCYQLPVVE